VVRLGAGMVHIRETRIDQAIQHDAALCMSGTREARKESSGQYFLIHEILRLSPSVTSLQLDRTPRNRRM
jgi:hypothetical protein